MNLPLSVMFTILFQQPVILPSCCPVTNYLAFRVVTMLVIPMPA